MTDKEKILAKIELLLNETNYEPFTDEIFGRIKTLNELKSYIDSLQEEPCNSCQGFNDKDKCDELVFTHNCPIVKNPVSIWHDASEKSNEPEEVVIINPSDNTGDVLTRCVSVYPGRIWAYTSELLNLDNSCKIEKSLQEESVSEDLEEEIKHFTTSKELYESNSVIKAVAHHFSNWQKKQDQETIELAEDHAMLAGMIKGKEEVIEKTINFLNWIIGTGNSTIEEYKKYINN